jgi:chromosome segregation protein
LYKLKKLELLGFKSFADRSRLEFADGVAAVVGPNGCGKSNISDAITWVLGEQSARLLRGERMSDVIFNGTGTRPPTGMAEVSMTLVNPEYDEAGLPEEVETIPVIESVAGEPVAFEPETSGNGNGHGNGHGNGNGNGHGADARPRRFQPRSGEITVTRRLFRSGESEYLINGDICRLRDIQDLFMGTGLGPESYAIIEQGRIGQILSSKPSDRRLILEEAAGVSKFKTRKRLAEAKLESSRQNLSRIADILEEVVKQVNSLKRQASKAKRYRELHDELRGRLKTVLTSRLKALEIEFQRLRAELAQVQETCLAAAQELEALEHEQKTATQQYETLEDQLTLCRERMSQGGLERERLLSRLEQVRQQTGNLEARVEEAGRESSELQAQLATLERQTSERAQQAEILQQEFAAAKDTLAQVVMQQEDLNFQLGAAEQDVESCRQSLMAVVSHAAELRNQLVRWSARRRASTRKRLAARRSIRASWRSWRLTSRNISAMPARWRSWRNPYHKPRETWDRRGVKRSRCAPRLRLCAVIIPAVWPARKRWSNHWRATPTARRACVTCFPARSRWMGTPSNPWGCWRILWKSHRVTKKWWKNF